MEDVEVLDQWLAGDGVKVLYFTAPWCHPCKAVGKALAGLEPELGDSVEFGKVDIDAAPGPARQSRVLSVPTVIVYKDGRELERHVGTVNAARLKKRLRSL